MTFNPDVVFIGDDGSEVLGELAAVYDPEEALSKTPVLYKIRYVKRIDRFKVKHYGFVLLTKYEFRPLNE